MAGQWASWLGAMSCAVAGVLLCVSQAAGRKARLLQDAKHLSSLSDLATLKELIPLVVAIAGKVICSNPIPSGDGNTGVAILQAVEEQHYLKQVDSGDWKADKVTISKSTREVPWALDDGSGVTVEIVNGRDADSLCLESIYDQFQPFGKSFMQSASDHMRGIRMLGIRRTERVLPVGASVTAIGELRAKAEVPGAVGAAAAALGTAGLPPASFSLQKPQHGSMGPFYVTTKTLPELVQSLSSVSKYCKWMAVGFGSVGVYLITSQLLTALLRDLRRRRLRARAKAEAAKKLLGDSCPTHQTATQGDSEGDQDRAANLCVVCLERNLDAVFVKCGHMCCCIECGLRLRLCPVCRRRTDVIKVFLP